MRRKLKAGDSETPGPFHVYIYVFHVFSFAVNNFCNSHSEYFLYVVFSPCLTHYVFIMSLRCLYESTLDPFFLNII